MESARIPDNEAARLAALQAHSILDTPLEEVYDDLTRLAAIVCGVPIALISFIDEKRQWFKSSHGLPVRETPRELAFCAHALLKPDELMIVPDALEDVRFHDNPLVAHEPAIRFYASAPLSTPEGDALGTICVIDRRPRTLTAEQQEALRALGHQAQALLLLRRKTIALEQAEKNSRRLAAVVESSEDVIISRDLNGVVQSWNQSAERILGYTAEEMIGRSMSSLFPPEQVAAEMDMIEQILRGKPIKHRETTRQTKDGKAIVFSIAYSPILDVGGNTVGVSTIGRDITERKLAAEQRQAHQLRGRLLQAVMTAREEEQKRIARDLHDGVGQCLSSLNFGLQAAKRTATQPATLETLVELQEMLANAMEDVQRMTRKLRPPLLDELSLSSALQRLANDTSDIAEILVDFEGNSLRNRRFSNDLETTLFRIAQESLNNIVKHAAAKAVEMSLSVHDQQVELCIRDDGCGFDTKKILAAPDGSGWGLLGMKERAELAGGTLSIESTPGQGTTITVCFPREQGLPS